MNNPTINLPSEPTLIKIVAILTIAFLEAIALTKGIDGALFAPAIAIIGGIAGYELRGLVSRKMKDKDTSEIQKKRPIL